MYFGSISNYSNGGKACKIASRYHEDGRFQSHSLTSWLKISKMFLDNLPKMQENASIDWVTHPKVNWEYVTILLKKKKGNLVTHTSKWGIMPYLLFPIWTTRCMDFGHLPTHVPFTMLTFWWWQGRDVHNVGPHWCLYEQFSLWMAMPQHWEYNRFNTPNKPQAWGVDMKWIWNVDMFVITWGNQCDE